MTKEEYEKAKETGQVALAVDILERMKREDGQSPKTEDV